MSTLNSAPANQVVDRGLLSSAVILSISSDIGTAIAKDWIARGIRVKGTFRTENAATKELRESGVELCQLDLGDIQSICRVAKNLGKDPWSRLVLAAGTQEPVGLFIEVEVSDWVQSINTNFTGQMAFLKMMLASRDRNDLRRARVLAFAGGGTNQAVPFYSAYTVSKIAQIKMMELLAAEMLDTAFFILGPGWVKTKIHEATLKAGLSAGENLTRTAERFEKDDFYPVSEVVKAVNRLFEANPEAVTGRNFSAVHDPMFSNKLEDTLLNNPDLFKLRRHGNDLFSKEMLSGWQG